MVAELDVPEPGDLVNALVDGQRRTVTVVSVGEGGCLVNVPGGPQRTLNHADILGPAEDPFKEEAAAVVSSCVRPPLTLESLSADEAFELEALEEDASLAFDAIRESGYEAGRALGEISEKRLYRATHGTFEDYCRERWEIGRAQAYSLMDFAKVRGALSARADIKALPENPKQVRELKAAGELAPEAWLLAVERKGGEQPTAREVAQAVEDVRYDYHGHQVGDAVWWFEADTQHVRAGEIERLHRGEFLIRPTDGGGPALAFPLPFERIGKGNQPGPATPFGICDTCREPLTGRDHCADCQRRSEDAADRDAAAARAGALTGQAELETGLAALKLQAQAQAGELGHALGEWERSGGSALIVAARCTHCNGGVSLFGNENPPNLSFSPKLKTQCVPITAARPADGRVDPETAPLEDAEDTEAIRAALKGLPAGEVLAIYGRVRRSDALGSPVRAQLCRSDLDRRRDAGIDLPWCAAHGDYQPCRECDRAADRVEQLAETAGIPEIAGELKTAAGITPEAKPGFLKSAAEKVAEKISQQPATPPKPSAWEGKTQAVISNAIAERLVTVGAEVDAALTGYCDLFAVADEFGVSTDEAVGCLKRFLAACCDAEIDPDNVIDAIPGIARDFDAA